MSGGFRVVMSEVLAASGVFERESRGLSGLVPSEGLHAPDGGDGVIDAALSDALRAVALTTGQFGAVVGDQGWKLRAAHDRYKEADDANSALIRQIGR